MWLFLLGPSIIVNIKPSVQNILFEGGRPDRKNIDTLTILAPFFIIFKSNYSFEKCWFVHFLRRRGSEKLCVLYTHLNVDNYWQPVRGLAVVLITLRMSEMPQYCLPIHLLSQHTSNNHILNKAILTHSNPCIPQHTQRDGRWSH